MTKYQLILLNTYSHFGK